MRHKSISSRLNALPSEKKAIALCAMAAFISCFLPWYGINSRVINEWWNVFNSIGSVAGYIIAVFSLLSLALILLPLIRPGWDFSARLPGKESSWLILFNAQSLFVTLIFVPVYTQYSFLNATNSGTRFGIYVALISTLLGTIFSLSYSRKLSREPTNEDFIQVPRSHRSVSSFEESEENPSPFEQPREVTHSSSQQESIFDSSDEQSHNTETHRY